MKSLQQSAVLALTVAMVAGIGVLPAHADTMMPADPAMSSAPGDAMMKKDDAGKMMAAPDSMAKPADAMTKKMDATAKKPAAMNKDMSDKMTTDTGMMSK